MVWKILWRCLDVRIGFLLWRCLGVFSSFFGGVVWFKLGLQFWEVEELVRSLNVGLALVLDGLKVQKVLVWWIVSEDGGRFL